MAKKKKRQINSSSIGVDYSPPAVWYGVFYFFLFVVILFRILHNFEMICLFQTQQWMTAGSRLWKSPTASSGMAWIGDLYADIGTVCACFNNTICQHRELFLHYGWWDGGAAGSFIHDVGASGCTTIFPTSYIYTEWWKGKQENNGEIMEVETRL